MELVNNTRVFFEPHSHQYLLDGEKLLMGVTTLLAKHHLSADLSGIPEETLKAAAAKGTELHEQIESYDAGKVAVMTPLLEDYRKLRLKHIASEYLVSDNDIIASKIDGVYKGRKKNGVRLVDYKSTYDKHIRAWGWQLGIYKVLIEAQNPGLVVEDTSVIWIDKKTERIKEHIPIDPIPKDMVDELLRCERGGETYKDPGAEPQKASLILSDSEIAEYIDSIDTLARLNEQIKMAEKVVDAANKKVLDFMITNSLETLSADGGAFSIKKGYVRQTFDSKSFKEEHPKLAKKYEGQTYVSPSLLFKRNKPKNM